MSEKVNIKEFFKGYITPVSWWKSIGIVSKFLIIIFLIFVFYKAFFKETQQQTQIFKGKVGKVEIRQDMKKTLIPFAEVYTEQRSNDKNLNFGVRCGIRVEF